MSTDTGGAGPGPAQYRELQGVALAAVEDALSRVPLECLSDVDVAERAINRLRDTLIDGQRGGQPGLQPALDRANVALSLVVGVEYPATGSQRQGLEMARDTLRDIQFEDSP